MLVFPRELASPQQGAGKNQHDQLVKESTALGNLLLQAEKAAPQLRTHLGNLLAGESVTPLQTQRENLGQAMDRKHLGGGNPLVTP